jgi:hypothetical protein
MRGWKLLKRALGSSIFIQTLKVILGLFGPVVKTIWLHSKSVGMLSDVHFVPGKFGPLRHTIGPKCMVT